MFPFSANWRPSASVRVSIGAPSRKRRAGTVRKRGKAVVPAHEPRLGVEYRRLGLLMCSSVARMSGTMVVQKLAAFLPFQPDVR